jgi:hypothetical protein
VIYDCIRVPELLAGLGIEGMKAAVDRGDEDPSLPDRYTAINEVTARIARRARIGPGVELPKLVHGRRIEGVDVASGPRCVHSAVDYDRRRFLAARRAQIISPGESKAADVAGVNLR